MRRMILAVLALFAVLALPHAANAEPKPKKKLYFTAGGAVDFGNGAIGKHPALTLLAQPTQGFDDIFGKGFSFNGYFGGPIMDNVSLQVGYTGEFHSGKAVDLEAHWFLAELKLNPRLGRVDPYVLGGIGAAVGNIKASGVAANIDTNVEFAYTFAGGVDIYVTDLIALQPEVRVRSIKDSGIWVYPVSLGMNVLFLFE